MKKQPIEVILAGAGGYGRWYLETLLREQTARNFRLVGVVEQNPEAIHRDSANVLRDQRIPVFSSLEKLFEQIASCDLAVLSTPIHFHAEQTCLALSRGAHVLCEKPLCSSNEEIESMLEAEATCKKTVTVGYQWSFSPAIQNLKADILAGRFGRSIRLKSLAGLPRPVSYYRRNRWAGKQWTDLGQPVFDSPVNNAAAHFLHNMLYILGKSQTESASVVDGEADLWRSYAIENYDSAAIRLWTEDRTALLFYASHAVEGKEGPAFSFEFESATINYEERTLDGHDQSSIVARLETGEIINYGSPNVGYEAKLWQALESARTENIPLCGIAAAAAHSRAVLLVQKIGGKIRTFSENFRREVMEPSARVYAAGLQEALRKGYDTGTLFREADDPLFRDAPSGVFH